MTSREETSLSTFVTCAREDIENQQDSTDLENGDGPLNVSPRVSHRRNRAPRPLSSHQSAIDRDHGPGHIVRQVGRKELNHFGAILDTAEPPQGDQL